MLFIFSLISFLYRHLKGYRLRVFITIAAAVIQVGLLILTPYPIRFITDKISSSPRDPTVSYPFLGGFLNFFDRFCPDHVNGQDILCSIQKGQSHTLLGVIIFSSVSLIVLAIPSGLLAWFELWQAAYIGQNLSAKLRIQLFEHWQRLTLDWHHNAKKGDLIQSITSDIDDIEKVVTDGLIDLFAGALTLFGIIGIMFLSQWQLTLLALILALLLFLIIVYATNRTKKETKAAKVAMKEVANVVEEDVHAQSFIRALNILSFRRERFKEHNDERLSGGLRASDLQAKFSPLVDTFVTLSSAFILGIGAYALVSGSFPIVNIKVNPPLTYGILIQFLFYLGMLYQPMRDLSKLMNLALSASLGAEQIQDVFNQAPEISEPEQPYTNLWRLSGKISCENVQFGYWMKNNDKAREQKAYLHVIKNITLHIERGQKIALVGPSGGGKTTLAKLIGRLYLIENGSIKIDGNDIRDIATQDLRRNIAWVLQESIVFRGTVGENIALGRPEARIEEIKGAIVDAAKRAQIHEKIISLSKGYDTVIDAKTFSGGERQRLSIARAFLRDAPILILDEPTASLDAESEARVLEAIHGLTIGRTVIMISHRLNTLNIVDRIYVIKDGRIVEDGSFKQLKQKGGLFAQMLAEQNHYNANRAGNGSIIRSSHAPFEQSQLHYLDDNESNSAPDDAQQAIPAKKYVVLIEVDKQKTGPLNLHKNKFIYSIGRGSDNDIQVKSPYVSRHVHALLRWNQEYGTWMIRGENNLGGLIYMGRRVDSPLLLKHGDCVYLGSENAALHYLEME